jgi:hypothetical protein
LAVAFPDDPFSHPEIDQTGRSPKTICISPRPAAPSRRRFSGPHFGHTFPEVDRSRCRSFSHKFFHSRLSARLSASHFRVSKLARPPLARFLPRRPRRKMLPALPPSGELGSREAFFPGTPAAGD